MMIFYLEICECCDMVFTINVKCAADFSKWTNVKVTFAQ